jgi:hypothetical protein
MKSAPPRPCFWCRAAAVLALAALAPTAALAPLTGNAAPPAKNQPPAAKLETASVWLASPKRVEGKSVATLVLAVEDAGAFADDAAFAVVRVITGDATGRDGGDILALLPPAKAKAFVASLAPETKPDGGRRGGNTLFGSRAGRTTYKRLDAVFRTVGGEPVLIAGGGDAAAAAPATATLAALKKFGKPSAVLAEQLRAGGLPVTKYRAREFSVSQTGRSGRVETRAVLERFLKQRNTAERARDPKAKIWARSDLERALRDGGEFVFDDDAARTTWRIVK